MIRPNTQHTGPLKYNLDKMIDDPEGYAISYHLHEHNPKTDKPAVGMFIALAGAAAIVVLAWIFGV